MSKDLILLMEADAEAAREQYADASLTDLGSKAIELEEAITARTLELEALEKELEKIMRFAIPEKMTAVGIDEFGVGDVRIKSDIKVLGTLSNAPDKEAAVAYLEANGLAGVVRSIIELDFSEAERGIADALLPQLSELSGREAHMDRKLNAQTLMAFVRQKLREDPTFDYAKVGIIAFPRAKITKRK